PPEWLLEGRHTLERLPDDVTADRMQYALKAAISANAAAGESLAELRDALLGKQPPLTPRKLDKPAEAALTDAAQGLNDLQRRAVRGALASRDVFLIHGPPGTGKTRTIVAAIGGAVACGERVLACAPSNAAVDLLAERLIETGLSVVRVGHPARVGEALLNATLDARLAAHEEARSAKKLARDMFAVRGRLRRRLPREERRALRDELKALRRDLRAAERRAVELVMEGADVVCSTLAGAAHYSLRSRSFDRVVIDEAGQALEPACWIALARARVVWLAGDHRQLPPTVISQEAVRGGLAVTLFERLMEELPEQCAVQLRVQYRMQEAIQRFPSERFYEGTLEAAPGNAGHLARDLAGVDAEAGCAWLEAPYLVLDTAGAGFDEERQGRSASLSNPGEAGTVVRVVEDLLEAGLSPLAIGVIAPYSAQVALLRERLEGACDAGLTISTADGFQGREREVIIVTFTRANERGEIGFLGDTRRTNVAMTRARRLLILVLDSATLSSDPFYAALIEDAAARGALSSVWEHDLVE
ncbi:MAG: AAA domain-containing protein, partial [Planctomycetota bacterium]